MPASIGDVIRLWRLSRDAMGGMGCMPDAGGLNDQCAVLLDAFACLSAYEHEINDGKRKK